VIVELSKGTITMIEDNLKKRRGVTLYEKNPFMVELTTKTKRVTNKRGDMMLVNSQTGEVQTSIAGFWEAEEVDSTKFVKLFVKGVAALKELTGAGTKVFEVLYLKIQENIGQDQIYMSFSSVDQTLTPMSNPTYDRGMRELIEKGFLAATPNMGLYWINPSFIWNGDRLAFVKEYWKKPDKPKRQIDTRTGNLFDHYQNQQQAIAQDPVPAQAPVEPLSPATSAPAQDEVS
jgi:Firmicute plasmid replication protein (RepL)